MKIKKILPWIFLVIPVIAAASPLFSPAWGFRLDPPENYRYAGGDGKDRFSFNSAEGASLDVAVYPAPGGNAPYGSVEALARDVRRRLGGKGAISFFEYRRKKAAVLELVFSKSGGPTSGFSGWGLCVELGRPSETGRDAGRPLLLALAYGPEGKEELAGLYLSALDSIVPEEGDRRYPGPITEFGYPRQNRRLMPLASLDAEAWFYEEDAEASQALVDREFGVLKLSPPGPSLEEARKRFYRAIYRDAFDRLADAAFVVERKLNVPPLENRDLAEQALRWVQGFEYQRDLMGSDFVNLVSAVREGRGDCDSRAMLWTLILNQANIPAAIMISAELGHAMALAELPGTGARFETSGKKWLVAETTAKVALGLIAQDYSEISKWTGILFE
ncbi:MAG: hypothetical protein LBQ67_02695 [Treponema sp.]|nr:hypothetical protein [Treponema sp.]